MGTKSISPQACSTVTAGSLEVLLQLKVLLRCSPCPSPAWGCALGCPHFCSSGSVVVWMKLKQCYTQRLFLVTLTGCVLLFLVLEIFLFPLHISACTAWMRRDRDQCCSHPVSCSPPEASSLLQSSRVPAQCRCCRQLWLLVPIHS